jgi:ribosomal protein L18E
MVGSVDIVPGKLLMWRNSFSKDAVEKIQHYGEVCVLFQEVEVEYTVLVHV